MHNIALFAYFKTVWLFFTVHIENGNKHVQPAWKHGTSNVWGKSPPTQTEKKYNRPLKPHVENGASMTDRQDQAADYRPKKGLFINKIRYVSMILCKCLCK